MADVAGWRWIPHAEHVWIPARLKLEDPATKIQTWTTVNNEDIEFKAGELDESKLESVSETSLHRDLDNLVQLDEFGEGAIVHQLRKRYVQDKIYTTIGTILVSVNPYKLLPIYTSSVVDKYREDYTNMPPHCFQIAADAYKRLLDEGMNQAVIISGESGAGKTEATKTVLQYLSDVAGSTSNVEQQILQSNPCLEAFGNAKTIRNDNSSRFGKWMEVIFAVGGRICAARIINYLLEKSRVVKQA
jgi:myosin heavy subunit